MLATQSCECIKCMFPHGCCFMAMCWLKLVTYHMQHLFHLISSPNHFPLLNVHEHIQLQFQEFCILTKFLSMVQCIMGRNLKIKKKLPNVGMAKYRVMSRFANNCPTDVKYSHAGDKGRDVC